MSDSIYFAGNDQGKNDRVVVIFQGDIVYDGPPMNGKQLNDFYKEFNGLAERTYYHSLTDQEMNDPIRAIYGE